MKFSDQQIFAYDSEFIKVNTLSDLFPKVGDPKKGSEFAIGGLRDLRIQLLIQKEWYENNYPKLKVRELRKQTGDKPITVDNTWKEPRDVTLKFNRIFSIPMSIKQEDTKLTRSTKGSEREQLIRTFISILHAYELDYFPTTGDEFFFRNVRHSMSHIQILPSDYFQNTGFPMHICIDSHITQISSTPDLSKCESEEGKEESSVCPEGQPGGAIECITVASEGNGPGGNTVPEPAENSPDPDQNQSPDCPNNPIGGGGPNSAPGKTGDCGDKPTLNSCDGW